jgi:hypothetical protein
VVASSPDLIDENWDAPSGGAAESVPTGEVSPDDAPTSGDEWWVRADDTDVSEMVTADVVFGIRAGLIPATSLVWRDGMVDWLRLEDVPIFRLAALGAATRSAPPPVTESDAPELSIGAEEVGEIDAASAEAVASAPPSEPMPEPVAERTPQEAELGEPASREMAPEDGTPVERVPRREDATPVVRAPRAMAPEEATPVERAPRPPPPSARPPRSDARASAAVAKTQAPADAPSEPEPTGESHAPLPSVPPRKSRPERSRPQSVRPAPNARTARPSGSPPPAPVRARPSGAPARPSGSPPPVPVRSRPSSRPPPEDDVTRVKAPGMLPAASNPREATEPPRPKLEAREPPRIAVTPSSKHAESGDDEPALAVYSRPVPTLAFARPELTELTPDPVAHALVEPRRVPPSPAIEVRPASIAPGEVVPTSSAPPPPSVPDSLPDFTDATGAEVWPSSLRPGSSRATVLVAAAAVVAAAVIGLAIRSGSRSPSHRAAATTSAAQPAQRTSAAQPAPPAPRMEAPPSPAAEATTVASTTPAPAETAEAPDDSVQHLGSDKTEPDEKKPGKSAGGPATDESKSGLDDPAPAKNSEVDSEAKRRALSEPGF